MDEKYPRELPSITDNRLGVLKALLTKMASKPIVKEDASLSNLLDGALTEVRGLQELPAVLDVVDELLIEVVKPEPNTWILAGMAVRLSRVRDAFVVHSMGSTTSEPTAIYVDDIVSEPAEV